jgi:hypothetical protein
VLDDNAWYRPENPARKLVGEPLRKLCAVHHGLPAVVPFKWCVSTLDTRTFRNRSWEVLF